MKLVKRTLAVCLIVVMASALSILTTAYVVNTYIQSVLASFDIKLDGPAPGIGGFMKSLTGMDNKNTTTDAANDSKNTGSVTDGTDKGSADNAKTKSSGETTKENAPEDALPVMGEATSQEQQSGSGVDQQLVMTPEAMRDLKDNLPSDDKANIFNILMAKLPQAEMQKISKAMEDGLTESEVKELQQVIAKYVNQDEYDTLMKMLTPSSADTSKN